MNVFLLGGGHIMGKKTATEKSYHSNGFVCSNIYLNHLKWNKTLMKTIEANVDIYIFMNRWRDGWIERSKKEDRLKSFIERKQR